MHHIGRGGEKSAIERDGGGGGIAEKRRRRRNSRGFVAGRKGEGANPSSLSGSLPALALLRHRQKSGEDVQRWASPARFCSAAAGTREGAYYLVAPSLHEGVMKTEREGRRGWASRRGKEGSFCESKYVKMASETPHFDLKNGIYISFLME